MTSQFVYLLNAMEAAAQEENPAEHGYAEKRRAVLEYVAKLEAAPSATAASEKPTVFVAPSHCEARLAYSPTTGGVSCYACNAFSEYQPYPADRAKLVCKRTGEVVAVKPYSEYVK